MRALNDLRPSGHRDPLVLGRGGGRALLLAVALAPIVLRDAFLIDRLGIMLLLALVAVSLDLLWGHGGMLSLGHAVLVGGAGYAVALLLTGGVGGRQVPLVLALMIAAAAAALISAGTIWLGLHGPRPLGVVEFALLTLALGVLGEQSAGTSRVLGGRNGIIITERLVFGAFDLHRGHAFYGLAATLLVLGVLSCRQFLRSPSGAILSAARDDPERVELLGLDVARARILAGALAGALAGVAGGVIHVHDAIVTPGAVGLTASTAILIWVILGGRGTLTGPALAAVALQSVAIALAGRLLTSWSLLLGLLLIAAILVLPGGLHGLLLRLEAAVGDLRLVRDPGRPRWIAGRRA
jgi:ABC-type branched-subunit amino acid transport system permease subunit